MGWFAIALALHKACYKHGYSMRSSHCYVPHLLCLAYSMGNNVHVLACVSNALEKSGRVIVLLAAVVFVCN